MKMFECRIHKHGHNVEGKNICVSRGWEKTEIIFVSKTVRINVFHRHTYLPLISKENRFSSKINTVVGFKSHLVEKTSKCKILDEREIHFASLVQNVFHAKLILWLDLNPIQSIKRQSLGF